MNKKQQRFAFIIQQIDNLMEEAINILPENLVETSKAHWYANIMCALNDDNEFIGGNPNHMQDTLEEWIEESEVTMDDV